MRVPTNSNYSSMLNQVQQLSARQTQLQTQVSTGQRISLPEDDPAAMARYLGLDAERRQLTQYYDNASHAKDLATSSYSGLKQLRSLNQRSDEIATLGSGVLSRDAAVAYATEVNQLLEQGLQTANIKFNNDYLYAGTAVDTPPFTATRDAAGKIVAITYVGNSAQTSVQLSTTTSITPGTSGATNTGMQDFLTHLVSLRDALTAVDTTAVASAKTALETDSNVIIDSLSENGAVQMRIELQQTQQQTRLDNIGKLISSERDADMADSITKLSQASTAYEAALQSMAKIMSNSLLNYIN